LGPLASLTRVDACNPLLQAHPTWARDEHEGHGISTSHTPVSGHLASPLRARPRARPIWAGARGTFTRRLRDPPVSKRRHITFENNSPTLAPTSSEFTSTVELMASFNNQVVAPSATKLVFPITGGSSLEPANKKQKKEAQRRVHVGVQGPFVRSSGPTSRSPSPRRIFS
jgi:hypothetical protein